VTHPDNLPPASKIAMDNFNFSFSMANKVKAEIQNSYDTLDERINAIIESEKFYVSGIPVLRNILMLGANKNDLKKLSKALSRLSDLVEAHDQLETKLNVVKIINDDPHWFAWAFGDFSKDVDEGIDSIFKEIEE
jgi:chaperonin cofactor prefoldin